jgi:hypothetical protein
MARDSRAQSSETPRDVEGKVWIRVPTREFVEALSGERNDLRDNYFEAQLNPNVEFDNVLHFAYQLGNIEPLADYIASTKPLTVYSRRALAGFVRSLQKRRRGRPRNLTQSANAESREATKHKAKRDALHNVVYLVKLAQEEYRTKNRRKRVPKSVTEDAIDAAIGIAQQAFGTSPDRNEVRRLIAKSDRTAIAEK